MPDLDITGAAIESLLGYLIATFYSIFLWCFYTETAKLDLLVVKKDDWKIFMRQFKPEG